MEEIICEGPFTTVLKEENDKVIIFFSSKFNDEIEKHTVCEAHQGILDELIETTPNWVWNIKKREQIGMLARGYLQSATDEDRLAVWMYLLKRNSEKILPPSKNELFFDRHRYECAVGKQKAVKVTRFDPDNQAIEMVIIEKKKEEDWKLSDNSFKIIFNSEDFCEFRDKYAELASMFHNFRKDKDVELEHPNIEGYCWYCNTVHERPEDCEAW